MLKKIIEDKRILALYIIVIIALVIGFTYALNDTSLAINIETALIGVDEEGYGDTIINTSNIDFKPILDTEVDTNNENVIKIEFSVKGASTNELTDVIYDIALVDLAIDCELISPYIKWKLVKDGSLLSSGTLEKGIKDRRLVLTENQEDLPTYQNDYHNYTFYLWFSDSCQNSDLTTCFGKIDQSNLVGKKFRGKIEVELYTESKVGYGEISNRDASDNSACIGNNPYLDFDPYDFTTINTIPNAPNLDNGSLIPVYYDEDDSYTYTVTDEETGTEIEKEVVGVWKKADSSNPNNSWYNYSEKKWANAVVINSSSSVNYSTSDVNTIIKESDIDAFYVWIPRFKYKVWNITRQGGTINTYAYNAFSYGIQISFEEGSTSTGNVRCSYNVRNSTPDTVLSDQCYYNELGIPVKPTDNNKDYTAWYTHPAFTFGEGEGSEKTGFWIGKFETSGAADAPKILPDVIALTNQNVSTQFTTSKKLQGRFTNLDAHMLTNLEWGAVAYLSYSLYGTCNKLGDSTYCNPINQNNSNSLYTGRSGGAPANSDLLTLNNVYGTGGTARYNNYGYYNYKGYKLDSSTGEPTTLKYINRVASTTKNVTGVYDMSGGAWDYVMGNQVNASYNFQPSSSGGDWNEETSLDSKYYNAYSYGTTNNDQTAYNRSRLGDATAEVLGGVGNTASWNSSSMIATSYFAYSSNSWFIRGQSANNNNAGAFSFYYANGNTNASYTFRSSLS